MEEAVVKNLEKLLTTEVFNNLVLIPRESAAADVVLNGHLHEDAIPLLDTGVLEWTEYDLLAALTGLV